MFRFAQRTDWQFSSNPLIAKLEELKKTNTKILDLTESNPTRCGFEYPKEEILRPLSRRKNLDYFPSPQGSAEARKAVEDYYRKKGFAIPAERIFLTASTSEAYSFLFKLLINPDEGVLFPQPSYPLFDCLVDLHDIEMEYFPVRFNNCWKIDADQLSKKISNNTKAIVLVNPNNPTGSYVKEDELRAINQLCLQRNLSLISDEVFWDFALEDKNSKKVSLVDNKSVLTFTLSGISKTLALPQMKLSWIIINGPDELVEASITRLEIISDTYLSVSTPIQNSLDSWLPLTEFIQRQIKERLIENLEFIKKKFKAVPDCAVYPVEGGWYAILKLPMRIDEEEWTIRLLEHDKVFIHPGYLFSFPESGFLVISLLTPPKILQEGVERILRRLHKE